jgi:Flp pilus assembly protein TadD
VRRLWVALLLVLAACAASNATDRALSLVRQGRDAEAVQLLRKRIAENPDDMPARKLLVRVLAMNGDLGLVEKEVDAMAARLPPDDPTPKIELGHAYELTHKFEEALAAYDEAAARAPNSPAGPAEGGMRAAHWGEAEDALPRLEEAIRRGSRDPAIFHALGLVRLKLGDAKGAEEAYRAGLGIDPNALENALGLATCAVVREDGAAALQAYDTILAKRPKFVPAELGRAWALAKLGRTDEARKAIDRAESLGAPKDVVAKQRAALNAPAVPATSP